MGLKFDSVMSREFSGMRPQALIRPRDCKFPVSTTAPRSFEFQKRSQFFVRAQNEALTVAAICIGNEGCSSRWNPRLRRTPTPTGLLPASPVKQNRPCRAPAFLRADNGTIPSSFSDRRARENAGHIPASPFSHTPVSVISSRVWQFPRRRFRLYSISEKSASRLSLPESSSSVSPA